MALSIVLLAGCNKATSSSDILPDSTEESTYKTYSNSEFGFEFQYPSEWGIRAEPKSEGEPLVISKSETGGSRDYFVVWPGKLAENPETSKFLSEELVMIDGFEAKKELYMWGDYEAPVADGYTRLYIDRTEGNLDFTMEYPSNDDVFYQQILNSFSFSEISLLF